VVTSLLDHTCGLAMSAAAGTQPFSTATLDLRIDYMRPAVDREFRVEARTTRLGRTLGWADAQITTADGRLIATARGTFVR
jgi:uncharacterized protein (TIGR00369 family)